MTFAAKVFSFRWRLPLLILAILASIGLAFAWTAYLQMHRALQVHAGERIRGAAGQMADLFSQAATARLSESQRLAADPVVLHFVATGEAPKAVMGAFDAFTRRNPQAKVSLTARGGTAVERIAAGNITVVRSPAGTDGETRPPHEASIGPFTLKDGHVSYRTTTPVGGPPGEAGAGVGSLVIERSMTSSSGAGVLGRLMGSGAVLKLGNATGDVWTDLSGPVDAPPATNPGTEGVTFTGKEGVRRIGSSLPVTGTPWRVWVEFDEAALLAPARSMLRRMVPATLILIVLGAFLVRVASARVTRPLEELAGAADAIALGDYSRRVDVRRHDEIGRLGSAFNVMATRVAESREVLEARVQARTRELDEAREELDQFFSMSIDMLCIAGTDGRFKRVNPAWEEVLGWKAADLTSVPYIDLVHPEDVAATTIEAAKLAKGGTTINFENRYQCKDGTYRWLNWKSAAVPDRGLLYATARDVTEQKRAARELQQHASELAVVNRELEAFSYSVSHDLRAPLRSIDGFSQALLEDCADRLGPDGGEHLRRIRDAAQHMGRLIDDLLKLARVTRADVRLEMVDLSSLARTTLEQLAAAEPIRAVDWCVQPDLRASADPRLIQIVLTNLLENAWKFTGKRGRAHIEVGARAEAGATTYFVKDNGAGFDRAYTNKLFGTFQRLHHASEFAGTGIGLATVQRIITRHGGWIRADSTVGEGATFSFTLQPEPQA
jgi:PAS domain S-box-containing protein